MTQTRLLARRSRRLAVLLLAVTGAPAATLVWLGLQLLQQERSLQAQRGVERQQAALGEVIRSLDASLADAERYIGSGGLPHGMTRLTLAGDGVVAEPAVGILWLPARRPLPDVESRRFADAERLEFQGQEVALASYQEAARSSVGSVRAGGLLRAARMLRRQRQWDQALAAYERLARIDGLEIEGAPSDLQARRAFVSVLEEAGRVDQMRAAAAALETDLLGGRWALDRPAWELATGDLARWLGRPVPVPPDRVLMSAVAEQLWQRALREPQPARRGIVVVDGAMVTVLSEPKAPDLVALAIAPATVRAWSDRAARSAAWQAKISLGGSLTETGFLKALSSDSGLPWTVAVGPIADASMVAEFQTRRRLLAVGLAAILLLLGGGSYFVWRVVEREMAVARLQTDFVAAVSHELRTPLTALRHVTELLAEDDEMPKSTRAAFYEALGRNTDRLHRLVESLLDFARMESGRKPYDPQPLDAGALASEVVADFSAQRDPQSVAIEVDLETPVPRIRADRASLSTALWNLLDNAIKYSPAGGPVRVSVRSHPAGVAIAVGDRGLGVPTRERAEIFQRFVRGAQARQLGIKGTGLGLAMASRIAEAHGGHIELDSEEGAGSTFRLVLPAMS